MGWGEMVVLTWKIKVQNKRSLQFKKFWMKDIQKEENISQRHAGIPQVT